MLRGDFLLVTDSHRHEPAIPRGQPDWAARALTAVPLFASVPRRHLRRVTPLVAVREYGGGVRVVRAGAQGETFHIVLEGNALVELADGEELRLRPGDGFGELALIDGAPRAATVVACDGLVTGCITRKDFRRLLRDEPAVAVGLLSGLVGVVRALQHEHATNDAGTSARKSATARDAAAGDASEAAGTALPEGRGLLGWMLALRHVPLFAPLSDKHLRRVARLFTVKRYRDGTAIVRAGDPGDSFGIVLDGEATAEGTDGTRLELKSGDSFGELALLDGATRSATITAHGEVTVAQIPRSRFQKLLRDEPQVAVGLVGNLVRLIRELQAQGSVSISARRV